MENVRLVLMDNNYTPLMDAELKLDPRDAAKLTQLVSGIEDGLLMDHSRTLCIAGASETCVELTITHCENAV